MSKEEHKQEKPGESSRLGKEAKIGVAVILALLLVLGAVATMRLTTGSSEDDKLALADTPEGSKEKTGIEDKKEGIIELSQKSGKSKHLGAGNQATVVLAKPASIRPSENTVGNLDQWSLASDKRDMKSGGGGGGPSLGSPPPFMPEPPRPFRNEHADRYVVDTAVGRDISRARSLREADNDVRIISPGGETRPHSAGMDNGHTDSSGFATADSPPAAPPFSREQPRYRDIAASPQQQLPEPSARPSYPAGGGFSPAAGPMAQHRPDPFDRVASGRAYNDNGFGQMHRPGVSSYSRPPVIRDDGKYEVQPNDSFWTISEKLYGTGSYFKALAEQNRGKGVSEDRLRPGDLISAPTVAQLEKSYPDLCPKPERREAQQTQSRALTVGTRQSYRTGRAYTVAEGDTLFNIARYELGKASRWAEIYELNRDVLGKDFNYLTPGMQLSLPDGEKSDTLTRQSSNGYRR